MTTTRTNQTLQLNDGWRLGYAEYGLPEGKPVIYFHGNPGSRLDGQMLDEAALVRLKVRLIAPDRPGIGLSDFQPNRTLDDWPRDVVALADALGLERFAVMGLSGGGPYVSVCALKIPERLTAAAIVSGAGPISVPGLTKGMDAGRFYLQGARLHPWLAQLFLELMKSGLEASRHSATPGAPPGMPAADVAALACPGVSQAYFAMLEESWRTGTRGVAWDAVILARPWGFRLEEITLPVHLWHGEVDNMVPVAMGRYVAQAIPKCEAKYYPDEGHVSLLANHLEEIVNVLAA